MPCGTAWNRLPAPVANREHLILAGRQQCCRFSWSRCAGGNDAGVQTMSRIFEFSLLIIGRDRGATGLVSREAGAWVAGRPGERAQAVG